MELHAALLRRQGVYAFVDELGRAFEKQLEKGNTKSEPLEFSAAEVRVATLA
jgi:hypothetical protein